jgi:hypothetical protein
MLTHQEECLHLVLVLDGQRVDVEDRSVATGRDLAVPLDCLENVPAMFTPACVARQAVGVEKRLDSLGAGQLDVSTFARMRQGERLPEHVTRRVRRRRAGPVR